MPPQTHLAIDPELVGRPLELAPGRASCVLETTQAMVTDDRGLIHGGFVFGLADYAAMLAVNDPNVVLGAAETRFTAPASHPTRITATATVIADAGARREVAVEALADDTVILRGTFTCFVLDHHVLDDKESG